MLGFGCAIGWLSPALPWLQSSDTPLLSGPLTTEQTSWSGSIICLGGMAGNILFSALTLRIGAKMTLLSLACPQMVFFGIFISTGCCFDSFVCMQASWICMYFGDVAEHIYASRFLSGLAGGGVQTTMMLYLSQIADDDIRGILGTTSQLTRCVGTLMAYILGAYMNYVQLSLVFIGVTMLFTISFYGKPSTPQYFLKNGAIKVRSSYHFHFYKITSLYLFQDAENAFRYYKGFKPNQSCTQLQAAFERIQTISIESKETHDSSLKMIICKSRIIIGMTLDNTCTDFHYYYFFHRWSGCAQRSYYRDYVGSPGPHIGQFRFFNLRIEYTLNLVQIYRRMHLRSFLRSCK